MTETSTSKKILIFEDSPSQAAIIATLVEQAGYVPVVYRDLPLAVNQILAREDPSVVLLDLMLLDEHGKQIADGFQICREIKRHSPRIPVVIVTAEGDDEACEWAILQGANAFLQKPFAPEDLNEVLAEVLRS